MFLPARRATLLIPSGPAHDPNRNHLFILLTDPVDDPDSGSKFVLLVSLSSIKAGQYHDPTCALLRGDHPFIKNPSYIDYSRARIEDAAKVLRGVKEGLFTPQGTIEAGVFARICKGLLDSRHTVPKVRRFFETSMQ